MIHTLTAPSLRPELTPLPDRMTRLPLDARGYPVPFFVTWIDGRPEFRATDPAKWAAAVREKRCWICGQPRGVFGTFLLGPMCTITRTTSEPPCHHDCAIWAAHNCPFLVRPHMIRREDEFTRTCDAAGLPLTRNPGVVAAWTTRAFDVFRDHQRMPLITVGDPSRPVEWYCEARPATAAEVLHSIDAGLPALEASCDLETTDDRRQAARRALYQQIRDAAQWLPTP